MQRRVVSESEGFGICNKGNTHEVIRETTQILHRAKNQWLNGQYGFVTRSGVGLNQIDENTYTAFDDSFCIVMTSD